MTVSSVLRYDLLVASQPYSRNLIAQVQEWLALAGYEPGERDGELGEGTTRAIREFQVAHGLQADGLPGPQTASMLEKAAHAPRPAQKAAFQRAPVPEPDEFGSPPFFAPEEPFASPPEPGPPPRFVMPRVAADHLQGVDLLARRDRIEFLASVLSAQDLETPLAIGLFGDWGSGKSFFMRRLQERIVDITEASARRVEGDRTLYCSHIRQVSFNAWLHADSDIWPSFAAQVFRSVAGTDPEAPEGETQTGDLRRFQERKAGELSELTSRRAKAQALDARIDEVARELAARDTAIRERDAELRGADGGAAAAAHDASDILASLRRIRRSWRYLRAGDVVLTLVPIAVAATLALLSVFDPARGTIVAAGIAAVAGVIAFVARGLRRVDDVATLREEQAGLQRLHSGLLEERQKLEAEPAAAPLVPEYAEAQAERWLGRERLGAVTEIRRAFEDLSAMIGKSRQARLDLLAQGQPIPEGKHVPIDRVVVYVDDLDRCQPDVVVSVLETLKLLLSLPHFVVVVGVDSRWLFRSLELHFRDLLREGSDDEAWAATPQNYLEKIFQYSIVLQPIGEDGFRNLIEQLLAPAVGSVAYPAVEASSGLPTSSGDDPGPTPVQEHEQVDLTPDELLVTRAEIEFVKGLAPMFQTPRAAKRLANVYRLLRVSVGADSLLENEAYEPVLLLLGIGIGFPGAAGEVFAAIRESPPGMAWPVLVRDLGGSSSEAVRRVAEALGRSSAAQVADRPLASFRSWIPVVAEFSFHPWQELLPATTQS